MPGRHALAMKIGGDETVNIGGDAASPPISPRFGWRASVNIGGVETTPPMPPRFAWRATIRPQPPQFAVRARSPFMVDRKSTRLNSSHLGISYAVFCLKKKKIQTPADKRHRE